MLVPWCQPYIIPLSSKWVQRICMAFQKRQTNGNSDLICRSQKLGLVGRDCFWRGVESFQVRNFCCAGSYKTKFVTVPYPQRHPTCCVEILSEVTATKPCSLLHPAFNKTPEFELVFDIQGPFFDVWVYPFSLKNELECTGSPWNLYPVGFHVLSPPKVKSGNPAKAKAVIF